MFGELVWLAASERYVEPDVDVLISSSRRPNESGVTEEGGVATIVEVEEEVEKPVVIDVSRTADEEKTQPYIEIYTRREGEDRLVTSIEVLSITNKSLRTPGRQKYLEKQSQPFGQRLWTLGGILTALGCVAWGRPPGSGQGIAMSPDDGTVHRHAFGLTRKALGVGLAGWGVLVAWSALSRGGVMPPPKGDPAAVRVLTWNILLGSQDGPPWRWHGWSVRKIGILADLSY